MSTPGTIAPLPCPYADDTPERRDWDNGYKRGYKHADNIGGVDSGYWIGRASDAYQDGYRAGIVAGFAVYERLVAQQIARARAVRDRDQAAFEYCAVCLMVRVYCDGEGHDFTPSGEYSQTF
jgi:hypothetical protein